MKKLLLTILILNVLTLIIYSQKSKDINLPQSPITLKSRTDAEDENLKGKVRSVLLKGSSKKKSSEDFYNELGNWTKRLSYDSTTGSLFQTRFYGYIDGSRVEKSIIIDDENSPPAPVMPVSPNAPKKDLRYSLRFEYKYDEKKRLIEELTYSNDGKLWHKRVYTYTENKIEEITYQNNGKVIVKSISVLDSKGNLIESIYYGFDGGDWKEKSTYKYDLFDKNDNWIKRTVKFFRNRNGTEIEQWNKEEVRKITYYE